MSLRRDGALVVRAALQWLDATAANPFSCLCTFLICTSLHAVGGSGAPAGNLPLRCATRIRDQVMGHFQQELMRTAVGEVAGGAVWRPRGRPGRPPGNRPWLLYLRETLHVPLIVHWPAKAETRNSKVENGKSTPISSFEFRVSAFNDRMDAPVGLIDVAPTILDYLRVPPPRRSKRKPAWRAEGRGGVEAARRLRESLYAHDAFRCPVARPARGEV